MNDTTQLFVCTLVPNIKVDGIPSEVQYCSIDELRKMLKPASVIINRASNDLKALAAWRVEISAVFTQMDSMSYYYKHYAEITARNIVFMDSVHGPIESKGNHSYANWYRADLRQIPGGPSPMRRYAKKQNSRLCLLVDFLELTYKEVDYHSEIPRTMMPPHQRNTSELAKFMARIQNLLDNAPGKATKAEVREVSSMEYKSFADFMVEQSRRAKLLGDESQFTRLVNLNRNYSAAEVMALYNKGAVGISDAKMQALYAPQMPPSKQVQPSHRPNQPEVQPSRAGAHSAQPSKDEFRKAVPSHNDPLSRDYLMDLMDLPEGEQDRESRPVDKPHVPKRSGRSPARKSSKKVQKERSRSKPLAIVEELREEDDVHISIQRPVIEYKVDIEVPRPYYEARTYHVHKLSRRDLILVRQQPQVAPKPVRSPLDEELPMPVLRSQAVSKPKSEPARQDGYEGIMNARFEALNPSYAESIIQGPDPRAESERIKRDAIRDAMILMMQKDHINPTQYAQFMSYARLYWEGHVSVHGKQANGKPKRPQNKRRQFGTWEEVDEYIAREEPLPKVEPRNDRPPKKAGGHRPKHLTQVIDSGMLERLSKLIPGWSLTTFECPNTIRANIDLTRFRADTDIPFFCVPIAFYMIDNPTALTAPVNIWQFLSGVISFLERPDNLPILAACTNEGGFIPSRARDLIARAGIIIEEHHAYWPYKHAQEITQTCFFDALRKLGVEESHMTEIIAEFSSLRHGRLSNLNCSMMTMEDLHEYSLLHPEFSLRVVTFSSIWGYHTGVPIQVVRVLRFGTQNKETKTMYHSNLHFTAFPQYPLYEHFLFEMCALKGEEDYSILGALDGNHIIRFPKSELDVWRKRIFKSFTPRGYPMFNDRHSAALTRLIHSLPADEKRPMAQPRFMLCQPASNSLNPATLVGDKCYPRMHEQITYALQHGLHLANGFQQQTLVFMEYTGFDFPEAQGLGYKGGKYKVVGPKTAAEIIENPADDEDEDEEPRPSNPTDTKAPEKINHSTAHNGRSAADKRKSHKRAKSADANGHPWKPLPRVCPCIKCLYRNETDAGYILRTNYIVDTDGKILFGIFKGLTHVVYGGEYGAWPCNHVQKQRGFYALTKEQKEYFATQFNVRRDPRVKKLTDKAEKTPWRYVDTQHAKDCGWQPDFKKPDEMPLPFPKKVAPKLRYDLNNPDFVGEPDKKNAPKGEKPEDEPSGPPSADLDAAVRAKIPKNSGFWTTIMGIPIHLDVPAYRFDMIDNDTVYFNWTLNIGAMRDNPQMIARKIQRRYKRARFIPDPRADVMHSSHNRVPYDHGYLRMTTNLSILATMAAAFKEAESINCEGRLTIIDIGSKPKWTLRHVPKGSKLITFTPKIIGSDTESRLCGKWQDLHKLAQERDIEWVNREEPVNAKTFIEDNVHIIFTFDSAYYTGVVPFIESMFIRQRDFKPHVYATFSVYNDGCGQRGNRRIKPPPIENAPEHEYSFGEGVWKVGTYRGETYIYSKPSGNTNAYQHPIFGVGKTEEVFSTQGLQFMCGSLISLGQDAGYWAGRITDEGGPTAVGRFIRGTALSKRIRKLLTELGSNADMSSATLVTNIMTYASGNNVRLQGDIVDAIVIEKYSMLSQDLQVFLNANGITRDVIYDSERRLFSREFVAIPESKYAPACFDTFPLSKVHHLCTIPSLASLKPGTGRVHLARQSFNGPMHPVVHKDWLTQWISQKGGTLVKSVNRHHRLAKQLWQEKTGYLYSFYIHEGLKLPEAQSDDVQFNEDTSSKINYLTHPFGINVNWADPEKTLPSLACFYKTPQGLQHVLRPEHSMRQKNLITCTYGSMLAAFTVLFSRFYKGPIHPKLTKALEFIMKYNILKKLRPTITPTQTALAAIVIGTCAIMTVRRFGVHLGLRYGLYPRYQAFGRYERPVVEYRIPSDELYEAEPCPMQYMEKITEVGSRVKRLAFIGKSGENLRNLDGLKAYVNDQPTLPTYYHVATDIHGTKPKDIHIMEESDANTFFALFGRQAGPAVYPYKRTVIEFLAYAQADITSRLENSNYKIQPSTFDDFLANSDPQKRDMYRRAYESLFHKIAYRKTVNFFMKKDEKSVTTTRPRNISSFDARITVLTAPVVRKMMEKLQLVYPFATNKDFDGTADFIASHMKMTSTESVLIETDGSSWDAHQDVSLRKGIDNFAITKLFNEAYAASGLPIHFKKHSYHLLTKTKWRYRVNYPGTKKPMSVGLLKGTTFSGHAAQTTLGNSLRQYYAHAFCGRGLRFECVVAGDDCIAQCHKDDLPNWLAEYRATHGAKKERPYTHGLGLCTTGARIIDDPNPFRSYNFLSKDGMIDRSGRSRLARMLGRLHTSDFVSDKKLGKTIKDMDTFKKTITLGYQYLLNDPILRPYQERRLLATGLGKEKDLKNLWTYWQLKHSVSHRNHFDMCYQILASMQKRWRILTAVPSFLMYNGDTTRFLSRIKDCAGRIESA